MFTYERNMHGTQKFENENAKYKTRKFKGGINF